MNYQSMTIFEKSVEKRNINMTCLYLKLRWFIDENQYWMKRDALDLSDFILIYWIKFSSTGKFYYTSRAPSKNIWVILHSRYSNKAIIIYWKVTSSDADHDIFVDKQFNGCANNISRRHLSRQFYSLEYKETNN